MSMVCFSLSVLKCGIVYEWLQEHKNEYTIKSRPEKIKILDIFLQKNDIKKEEIVHLQKKE